MIKRNQMHKLKTFQDWGGDEGAEHYKKGIQDREMDDGMIKITQQDFRELDW